MKALILISRKNSWAEVVHCKLISMLANMFYQVDEGHMNAVSSRPMFLVEQVDLIGGIEFIFFEVCKSCIMTAISQISLTKKLLKQLLIHVHHLSNPFTQLSKKSRST